MTRRSPDLPELLAPAGGVEALRAAVGAGADAVYLGLDRLNARRGAANFTLDALEEACRFAHLRGVRVYLTLNVVVLAAELAGALELVDEAWTAGVDAVIVQDLGLLRAVRERLPHVRVHASTQINTHDGATLRVLASRGVSRVTLAREVSLDEIASLSASAREAGSEAETFVHGAICVCYSGQCLLSSMIGGRSANRGTCAQPCRLPYELIDEKGRVRATAGAHLLSPRDLAGLTVLDRLAASGVAALKIEGRLKSADYVALVTGVYRSALDRVAEAGADGFEARDGEMEVLSEAFSRGFSEAYLTGERGNQMMSYRRPNNRGVAVGRIHAASEPGAVLALESALDSADTIEIWTSRGRFAQRAGRLTLDGAPVTTAPAGSKPIFVPEQSVAVGDRVFRVRNAALSDAAERLYAGGEHAPVPLGIAVNLTVGRPLEVVVTDQQGRVGSATGDVVEPARTRPVTTDDIMEHVGRLGGTAYAASSWDVTVSPDAGIGFSRLHQVRRAAIEALEEQVLAPWIGRKPLRPALPHLPAPFRNREPAPRIVASVRDLPSARACLQAGCESVYVPAAVLAGEPAARETRGVVASLPRVAHDAEIDGLLAATEGFERVQAATLGLLRACAERGQRVEAHWSLNAVNAYTVAELADLGAGFVWLSPELSSRQIAAVTAESAVATGIAVAGRQELMVTEHCILMAEGPCAQRCESCRRREGWRFLRDRKGYSFPVRTDAAGRSHVYNSVPLDLTHALPEVLDTKVSAIRLDLETEPANRAAAEVARVRRVLEDVLAGRKPDRADRDRVTAGHFFRGIG